MPPAEKSWHPFVVLIAGDSDVALRSLESVLDTNGYSVIRATHARDVLEHALVSGPDALIIDDRTRDATGLDLCRRLRGEPRFDQTVPIFLTTSHGSTRAMRLEAYGAGVWELCSQPIDAQVLTVKLETFLRARQASARIREGSLIDAATGLYNMEGLRRRARELGAAAMRGREALACIAFTPVGEGSRGGADFPGPVIERVANLWHRVARASDIIGRIEGSEFAIVAPETDAQGAVTLIDRLQHALEADARTADRVGPAVTIRAGYSATSNLAESSLTALQMLERAGDRLRDQGSRSAPTDPNGDTERRAD